MIRTLAPLVAALVFAPVLPAQDADPVKEKLLAAKSTHDAELKSLREDVQAWFDKREEAARLAGDKKSVDRIKTERAEFDDTGERPADAPPAFAERQEKALRALAAAYELAVKDYIRGKKDVEAAAVEVELKALSARLNTVNLLSRVNLKTHVLGGQWERKEGGLVGTAGEKRHARLQLPYEPGEEYDLVIRCRRVTGENCLGVGLVAGSRQVVAVLDAWPEHGFASGLELIQMQEANNNATTVKGQLLKPDQTHTVVYSVRNRKIDVTLNGTATLSYNGAFDGFSLRQDARIANRKALSVFFNPGTSFRIDRLSVVPVKGKGNTLK